MADFTDEAWMEERLIEEHLAEERGAAEQQAAAAGLEAAPTEPPSRSSAPQASAAQPAEAVVSAAVNSSAPQPLTTAALRAAAQELLTGQDWSDCTVGTLRSLVEVHLKLPPGALDDRRDEVLRIAIQLVSELSVKQSAPHNEDFDEQAELGQEPDSHNQWSYLITFSHPKQPTAADGTRLRPPCEFTRAEIRKALLQALEGTQAARKKELVFKYMVVFQERHADGEVHYHVALLSLRQFRFVPLKLHLLQHSHLASHWSTKYNGYAAAVAYGYLPRPGKAEKELDATPHLWANEGIHPPLAEASRPPVNAKALAKWREDARQNRAAEGKAERRIRAVDLWPVVVRENIPADAAGPELLMAWAKRCGGEPMVDFLFTNWAKLPEWVARSWKVERVEECIENYKMTRMEILQGAGARPCICGDRWRPAATELFRANGIRPGDWCSDVLRSLEHGRKKGTLICHAGQGGNEGKSFLFGPLSAVFGADAVFLSPTSASFPLLGLDAGRVVLLDDWRFNERILSYNMQLLWFEGKPIVIARPQNQFTGHLRYDKDAPIFISTLASDIVAIPDGLKRGDVEMMLKRLRIYQFQAVLVNPVEIKACPRCFAAFLFEHSKVQSAPPPACQPAGGQAAAGPADQAQPLLPTADGPVATDQRASEGKRVRNVPPGTSPGAKRSKGWSVEDVCSYLERLELDHLTDKFRVNGVDGEFLADLSEQDLVQELGLTKLQARKVLTRLP